MNQWTDSALGKASALALLGWVGLAPATLVGQTPPAPELTLGGILFDSTHMAPLVGAAVYLRETGFAAATDGQGRWGILNVPAGPYEVSIMHPRLDALGYVVPPTWRVEVGDSPPTIIELSLPSWKTLLEVACGDQSREKDSHSVVGVVEDDQTGMPLPGATVEFTWAAGGLEVTADGEGHYWACGLPTDRTVVARARFYGATTPRKRLFIPEAGVAEMRFGFDFEVADESLPIEVAGRIADQVSGDPISNATVRLDGPEPYVGLSQPNGRFRFENVEPGAYVLRVEHRGYGARTQAVVVEGGGMFELEVGLAVTEAIELPGILVTARSARERERLARGSVVGYIGREEIAKRETSARHMGDLIRGTIHALTIREEPGFGGLCIETRRERAAYPDCNMVMVFVDNVQIFEPGSYVTGLSPMQIESIEFVPSSLAGARYGSGSRFGVLLIETRKP